ncbi:hypothetical protein [Streptomyces youssoufiensis]
MKAHRVRYATAEVDIADYLDAADDDELAKLGLHDANSCPRESADELHRAITALHQQAHPDQPLFPDTCLREPCRSLSAQRHPDLGR